MPTYLPIVLVAPVYPAKALRKRLEGHVELEFTVTAAGTTTDVTVVESTNSLFDAAAQRAVGKYKYKPCVADGRPVATPGVVTRVDFALEPRRRDADARTRKRGRLW